jgi:hypothetical protein
LAYFNDVYIRHYHLADILTSKMSKRHVKVGLFYTYPESKPKGSKNKERVLDPHKDQIREYLEMGLNLAAIMKLVNPKLEEPVTYNTFRYFVKHEKDLRSARQAQRASKGR